MPINTSRYRRSVEWDGPKKPSQKPVFTDANVWRKRFYLLLIAALVVVVALGGVLGYILWKNRDTKSQAETSTATDNSDVSSWKKSENASVGLNFLYPPDWKFTQNKTTTDLDLLNIQLSGTGSSGVTATVKVDVIKDASNLSLADWVKQFGPKDIQTESSKIAGENALLAKFSNGDTGEEQNVYYVLKNSGVYVFDLYQSAKDDTLQQELKDFAENISFTTASTTDNSTEETPTTSGATQKLLVNTTVTSFTDEFSSYNTDGTGKKLVFTDKDEAVYLKGNAEICTSNGGNNVLVGFFGKTGSTSKDGIYAMNLGKDTKLKEIVSGVTPGLVRVSRDCGTVGYLNGAKGVAKSIVLVGNLGSNNEGQKIKTISADAPVQYFILPDYGSEQAAAYVEKDSGTVKVSGSTQTFKLTTKNIFAFDWLHGEEPAVDAFVFTADAATKPSSKTELYYFKVGGTTTALTTDSVTQDSPHFYDQTKVAYQSYTSGTSGKSSVWVIGTDGRNDTNIVKSGNNLIAGWFSE